MRRTFGNFRTCAMRMFSKKLSFEDRLTLMYAKGLRYFEDEPVYNATDIWLYLYS